MPKGWRIGNPKRLFRSAVVLVQLTDRVLCDPAGGPRPLSTRGRSLVDGVEELKIHGQYVPVRAHVSQLEGLSAHADHVEMVEWLRSSGLSPRRVFVTHGEPAAADAFRRRLYDTFGWDASVPELAATVLLSELVQRLRG